MISIYDVLGPKWAQYKLYDDNTLSTGGLSREEETLGEFLSNTDIDQYDSVALVQSELKMCGIHEIKEIDRYVEELIQQKIWDIEEEFDVKLDYNWDYKY